MSEGDLVLGPDTAAVGPAVQHRREHAIDEARIGGLAVTTQDSDEAAHAVRLYQVAPARRSPRGARRRARYCERQNSSLRRWSVGTSVARTMRPCSIART